MSNTISVVIPYFNDSPAIERCLKSVFNQTLRPNQIIIVDDCSDDSAVLVEIVANIPNEIDIILHHNDENKNGAYSRNYGVSLASGDYIAFLDGDDYWLEKHLELSLNKALETNADFVYSNVVNIDAHGKQSIRKVTDIFSVDNQPDVLFMSPPQTNSFLFKKNLYKDVTFDENLRRHQDYQFLLDVILKNKKHVYGDFSTACYCVSHRSFSSRFNYDSSFSFWGRYCSVFSRELLHHQLTLILLMAIKENGCCYQFIEKYCVLDFFKSTWQYKLYEALSFSRRFRKVIFTPIFYLHNGIKFFLFNLSLYFLNRIL